MRPVPTTRARGPVFLLCLAMPWSGCASPRDALPDIARIYEKAALHEARNPVVVIHGILGARLGYRDSQKTVWGAFTDRYSDPATAEGRREMSLPLRVPGPATGFDPAKETIIATGPLETLQLSLLFQVFSVDVYRNILRTLGAGMYRDPILVDPESPRYAEDHFTCYSFFYDWRRDNVTNAILFGRFLTETRKTIDAAARKKIDRLRREGGLANTAAANELQAWLDRGYRFDVVAHSMGGLVARYFLRYGATDLPADGGEPVVTWKGAAEIDRLVMVGTPNLGSMAALEQLLEGFTPGITLPTYDQVILGSMPSIYQLLPRNRHKLVRDRTGAPVDIDLFDPEVWERNAWGLLGADTDAALADVLPGLGVRERRKQAKEYLAWCLGRAKAFHRAIDKRAESKCPAAVYLFAADSQQTLTRSVLEDRQGRLVPTFAVVPANLAYGDRTVARYSAVGDEREGGEYTFGVKTNIDYTNVTFLSDDHIGLTRNPHFSNNLLHILLETPPPVRPGANAGATLR